MMSDARAMVGRRKNHDSDVREPLFVERVRLARRTRCTCHAEAGLVALAAAVLQAPETEADQALADVFMVSFRVVTSGTPGTWG